jgi:recombination protein RecA
MTKLDELFNEINKQYKEQVATMGKVRPKSTLIPFSSLTACYSLYGGLPRGRVIEFFGEENGGKTTTALDIVANAQKCFQEDYENELNVLLNKDKLTKADELRLSYLQNRGRGLSIVWIDCENTFDEDWARTLGVDVESLYFMQPLSQSAEQIFQNILDMVNTGEVGLVVLDSLGAMISQQEWEKTMEEKTYCGIAGPLTKFSKMVEYACAKYGCTFIGINQMREDISNSYVMYKTPGGKTWKHVCSLRLMFSKGPYYNDQYKDLTRSSDGAAGNYVNLRIEKTKVCKPDRKNGSYTLNYTTGIDQYIDLVEMALKYNIIVQAGAWYSIIQDIETGDVLVDAEGSIAKFNGKSKLIEYLKEEPEIFNYIQNTVMQFII